MAVKVPPLTVIEVWEKSGAVVPEIDVQELVAVTDVPDWKALVSVSVELLLV